MSWNKVKLGDISMSIQPGPFGSQLHSSDYSNEGTPIIMPKDMIDGHISHTNLVYVSEEHVNRLSRHQVHKGNLMVARKGDVRKCVFITDNEEGWMTGSDCLKVTLDDKTSFVVNEETTEEEASASAATPEEAAELARQYGYSEDMIQQGWNEYNANPELYPPEVIDSYMDQLRESGRQIVTEVPYDPEATIPAAATTSSARTSSPATTRAMSASTRWPRSSRTAAPSC